MWRWFQPCCPKRKQLFFFFYKYQCIFSFVLHHFLTSVWDFCWCFSNNCRFSRPSHQYTLNDCQVFLPGYSSKLLENVWFTQTENKNAPDFRTWTQPGIVFALSLQPWSLSGSFFQDYCVLWFMNTSQLSAGQKLDELVVSLEPALLGCPTQPG